MFYYYKALLLFRDYEYTPCKQTFLHRCSTQKRCTLAAIAAAPATTAAPSCFSLPVYGSQRAFCENCREFPRILGHAWQNVGSNSSSSSSSAAAASSNTSSTKVVYAICTTSIVGSCCTTSPAKYKLTILIWIICIHLVGLIALCLAHTSSDTSRRQAAGGGVFKSSAVRCIVPIIVNRKSSRIGWIDTRWHGHQCA